MVNLACLRIRLTMSTRILRRALNYQDWGCSVAEPTHTSDKLRRSFKPMAADQLLAPALEIEASLASALMVCGTLANSISAPSICTGTTMCSSEIPSLPINLASFQSVPPARHGTEIG